MDNIVFYDGECKFCNGSVNFIIRNDKKTLYKFMPLQSPDITKYITEKPDLKTIYLLKNGKIYDRSTAALKIAATLGFPYSALGIFLIVPKFVRDAVYNFISENRYLIAGKNDTCMVPDEHTRARFL